MLLLVGLCMLCKDKGYMTKFHLYTTVIPLNTVNHEIHAVCDGKSVCDGKICMISFKRTQMALTNTHVLYAHILYGTAKIMW